MGQFNLATVQKPLSLGIFLLLGGYSIYLVVENVLFYLDADLAAEVSHSAASVQDSASSIASNGPSLATRQLFGRADDNQQEEVISAPTTRLNLELQGVFLSDVPSTSSAIVAERGKDGKLYLVGDKLPGNSVLHSVESNHILLRRGARLEKLLFITKRLNIEASNSATASTSRRPSTQGKPTSSRPTQASQSGSPSAGSAILSAVRDRLQRNPQAVLKEYGLSAVAPGSSQGYKVDTAHPALNNTGLQPGDRVVSVNGAPLGVAMNDARLIDQARAAGRVRVEVERGGRRFFLTIPIP
ncbi:MAG: general secretion pathway protein C [Candidatus Azotimanducaceae bacterium]|jgi:general secretion pathway protein C|tara:strand:+ start:1420 stop:2316 length:897 start_codon:yes stop_codon:yes gene_type:complete